MTIKEKSRGFTLVETMIVVAIIGLIAVIGIPSIKKARITTQEKIISNNIQVINSSFNQYAISENITTIDNITLAQINDYIEGGLNHLTWPIAAPAETTTHSDLEIEFNGKLFTCDHPEGIKQ